MVKNDFSNGSPMSRKEHDVYQEHPLHAEFLEKVFRPRVKKVALFDFV